MAGANMRTATYKAFCRHDGNHATQATGNKRINWNQEVIHGVAADLEDPWQAFLVGLEQRGQQLTEHIEAVRDNACRRLGESITNSLSTPGAPILGLLTLALEEGVVELGGDDAMESLIQSLSAQADHLSALIDMYWADLENNMRFIALFW